MKTQAEARTTPVRGHYSLIQFCPDTARLEAANIGIALFCGQHDFLQVRMNDNNGRVIQMFGRGERDLDRLRAVKKGLHATIEGRRELRDLEQLQRFAALQINHLRMTPFMPCRIAVSPEAELDTLYRDLVESPQEKRANRPSPVSISRALEAVFNEPSVQPFVRRDVVVDVPIFQAKESIPYAYQNGRLNLVKPVEFPTTRRAVIDKAARNAIEGKSIYDHPHARYGDLKLVVVGSFPKTDPDDIETSKRILEENYVTLYTTEELDRLEHDIVTNGHPVEA
jgi:hypothetical protein